MTRQGLSTRDYHELVQGWLQVACMLVQTHCLLWDHSPTYHARVTLLRDRLRGWLAPPPWTRLTGRLARDIEEAMGDG